MKTLSDLENLSKKQCEALEAAGYDLAQVATASLTELEDIHGIGEVTAKAIKAEAQEMINADLINGQQIAEHEVAQQSDPKPSIGGPDDQPPAGYSVRVARALQLRGELPESDDSDVDA